MEKSSDKKSNVLPFKKSDPVCNSEGSYVDNSIFLLSVIGKTEEHEEEVATSMVKTLLEIFELYQEDDFHAEIIYRDLARIQQMVENFYMESTVCPFCKSGNILVDESEDEDVVKNKCLDCQKHFETE